MARNALRIRMIRTIISALKRTFISHFKQLEFVLPTPKISAMSLGKLGWMVADNPDCKSSLSVNAK